MEVQCTRLNRIISTLKTESSSKLRVTILQMMYLGRDVRRFRKGFRYFQNTLCFVGRRLSIFSVAPQEKYTIQFAQFCTELCSLKQYYVQISCVEFHTKRTMNVEGKSTNLFTPLSITVPAPHSWNSHIGLRVNLKNVLVTDNYGTDKRTWSPHKAFLLTNTYNFRISQTPPFII